MPTEHSVAQENEALEIAEELFQQLGSKHHHFTLAAIAVARWHLNVAPENEADMEDCIAESCRAFYETTLEYMQRVNEREQQMLWQTSVALGVAVYGADRAQEGSDFALDALREMEAELDNDSPHASTALN